MVGIGDAKKFLEDGLKEPGITNANDLTITLSSPIDGTSRENAEYYKRMRENALSIHVNINIKEFAVYRKKHKEKFPKIKYAFLDIVEICCIIENRDEQNAR